MRPALNALLALLAIAWPLAAWLGLEFVPPRFFALAVFALLALRLGLGLAGRPTARALMGPAAVLAAGLVAYSAAVWYSDSETLLRLYPALVNLGLLAVFANSLRHPPSLIERLARLSEPELPATGVRYTRTVTQVWCGFFIVNGLLAAGTALYATRATWALYNGAIAYGLMGLLFAGEYWVRRRVRAQTRNAAA